MFDLVLSMGVIWIVVTAVAYNKIKSRLSNLSFDLYRNDEAIKKIIEEQKEIIFKEIDLRIARLHNELTKNPYYFLTDEFEKTTLFCIACSKKYSNIVSELRHEIYSKHLLDGEALCLIRKKIAEALSEPDICKSVKEGIDLIHHEKLPPLPDK